MPGWRKDRAMKPRVLSQPSGVRGLESGERAAFSFLFLRTHWAYWNSSVDWWWHLFSSSAGARKEEEWGGKGERGREGEGRREGI